MTGPGPWVAGRNCERVLRGILKREAVVLFFVVQFCIIQCCIVEFALELELNLCHITHKTKTTLPLLSSSVKEGVDAETKAAFHISEFVEPYNGIIL